MKTYNEMFLEARKRLKNAGIEAYSLEARLIMIAATGKTSLRKSSTACSHAG